MHSEAADNKSWDNFWELEGSKKFSRVSWSKKRIINVVSLYLRSGACVLDAGCGSGFFSRLFCDFGMNTVSLDYSESALSVTDRQTSGRTKTVKHDLLQDDLALIIQERFDVIFSDGLFEHFPNDDQDKIMRNLIELLNENGVIITFVPNRWSPWELIRPFFMPGIEETPFVIKGLIDLSRRNNLKVISDGGINVFPFFMSPEKLAARTFGMLLYTISKKQ